jgi:hypothetical protein
MQMQSVPQNQVLHGGKQQVFISTAVRTPKQISCCKYCKITGFSGLLQSLKHEIQYILFWIMDLCHINIMQDS